MYIVNKIRRKLSRRQLQPPTRAETELIDKLRRTIATLPQLDSTESLEPAQRIWTGFRAQIRDSLLTQDPRRFPEFNEIKATMFVDHPPYIAHELRALRTSAAWEKRWRHALCESSTVPAPACPYFPASSGTLIHHAFHLHTFERATKHDVSQFHTILEFGGGYGGMCRLVHELGFHGKYFIFDLPEFSALQEFYLRANGIPIADMDNGEPGAVCFSDFALFEGLNRANPPDLFVAMWSLSETRFDFRRAVLGVMRPRDWLIAYQHGFDGLDNASFFDAWRNERPEWTWQHIALEHMPGRNSYLVATPSATARAGGVIAAPSWSSGAGGNEGHGAAKRN